MHHYRSGFAITSMIFLAGCAEPAVEYVEIPRPVPAALLEPVAVPSRPAQTLKDVGLILTDHVQALDRANGQIGAIKCILTAPDASGVAGCVEKPGGGDQPQQ